MCFFFKQKTAYEMRISDWSSDVCSSDLHGLQPLIHPVDFRTILDDRYRLQPVAAFVATQLAHVIAFDRENRLAKLHGREVDLIDLVEAILVAGDDGFAFLGQKNFRNQ